eukprot:SAG31_NODE_4179_length_3499_cov_5.939412_1_plen_146_part_00
MPRSRAFRRRMHVAALVRARHCRAAHRPKVCGSSSKRSRRSESLPFCQRSSAARQRGHVTDRGRYVCCAKQTLLMTTICPHGCSTSLLAMLVSTSAMVDEPSALLQVLRLMVALRVEARLGGSGGGAGGGSVGGGGVRLGMHWHP